MARPKAFNSCAFIYTLSTSWTQEISFQTTVVVFHKWPKFINTHMKRRLTSSIISYKSTANKIKEICFIDPIPLFTIYNETTFNFKVHRLLLFKVFISLSFEYCVIAFHDRLWLAFFLAMCSLLIAFLDLKQGFLINKNTNFRSLRPWFIMMYIACMQYRINSFDTE